MLVLKFMDNYVAEIDLTIGQCNVINEHRLPFNLKLGSHLTPFENVNNFRMWCADRTLSLGKYNAKKICNVLGLQQDSSDNYRMKLALAYKCLTLDDAYWVTEYGSNLLWDDVNLFENKSENVLTPVSLCGKVSTVFKGKLKNSCDLSVNGTFAKSWIRDKSTGELYLVKADSSEESRETFNEVDASKILIDLGADTVSYSIDYVDGVRVSKCKCFTSKDVSFIPYSVFRKVGCYEGVTPIEWVKSKFKREYANMCVANYLIGNEDLHDGNWGLLLDNKSFSFIGLVPLFDFNYAFSNTYKQSANLHFIPEIILKDISTGEIIPEDKDYLDYEYEIVSKYSNEEIAIKEYVNCNLNLDEILYNYGKAKNDELKRRVNMLLNSTKLSSLDHMFNSVK